MPQFNKQLYENSGLKELFVVKTDEERVPERTFFNQKDPNLAILHEKPEHRLMIMMKARGCSNMEIAEASGYTSPWISQLFRQPWARARLSEEINKAGRKAVDTVLEGEVLNSIYTLVELRDDTKQPGAVRGNSAERLLDRHLGKPTQMVKVETSKPDIKNIDAELQALEAEEKRLMGLDHAPVTASSGAADAIPTTQTTNI